VGKRIVLKAIAKVIYDWLANDIAPIGIPPAKIEGFRNTNGQINTIPVDSKVVHETDTGKAKSDEARWIRLTLDTVGKTVWLRNRHGSRFIPRVCGLGSGEDAVEVLVFLIEHLPYSLRHHGVAGQDCGAKAANFGQKIKGVMVRGLPNEPIRRP
jgi:hypothetical protein